MTDPVAPDVDVFEDVDGKPFEAGPSPEWQTLPQTGLFDLAAADALGRREATKIVAVIGERGGGKTTLVSAVYERLLGGRFAGHAFAGSRTLSGLEERSFLSRAASGRDEPTTPRTSGQEGLSFFHLALAPTERPTDRVSMLLSERAGEHYRNIRDRPAGIKELPELWRADHLVFVIDGGRMAKSDLREELQASVRQLVRIVRDAGLPQAPKVEVVATKMDLFPKSGAARRRLVDFQKRLTELFSADFADFAHFAVTARDPKGKTEVADGVDALVRRWAAPHSNPTVQPSKVPELATPFDRFLDRWSTEVQ